MFANTSRPQSTSIGNRLVARSLCVLLALGTIPAQLVAASAGGNGPRPANNRREEPGITITSPRFGATKTDATVEIAVDVSKSFELSTLTARLNGEDISEKLSLERCKAKVCTMKGAVTMDEGLREGSNHLVVSVSDKRHRQGAKDRTRFTYHDPMGPVTDTNLCSVIDTNLCFYTPASVGIETSNDGNPPWLTVSTGYPFSVDPFELIPLSSLSSKLGGTLSLSYTDNNWDPGCDAGYQAITLDRKNPTVEAGAWCGSSVSDFLTSSNPGPDDFVVFGTNPGRSNLLDWTPPSSAGPTTPRWIRRTILRPTS